MPYVTASVREELKTRPPRTSGELNYMITMQVKAFLATDKESYCMYNSAIGALECAKLELYRRLAVAYEDRKIKEHGDVY